MSLQDDEQRNREAKLSLVTTDRSMVWCHLNTYVMDSPTVPMRQTRESAGFGLNVMQRMEKSAYMTGTNATVRLIAKTGVMSFLISVLKDSFVHPWMEIR